MAEKSQEFCADAPTNPRWKRLVTKARRTNAQRDAGDRANGWAAPGDTHPVDALRTALPRHP